MSDNNDLFDGEAQAPLAAAEDSAAPKKPTGKMENVRALGKDPKKLRVMLATLGAVVLVGGITAISLLGGGKKGASPSPASASVGQAPSSLAVDPNAVLAESQQYKDIVAATGKKRSEDALKSGESNQPLATTVESALKRELTPAEVAKAAMDAERLKLESEQAERARLAALMAGQSQTVNPNQAPDPTYANQLNNAQLAIASLLKERVRGSEIFSMAEQSRGRDPSVQQASLQAGLTAQPGQLGAARPAQPPAAAAPAQFTLISAGQIESVRIDTGMNTDLGGDFGATLLTGKYAGAKLIGTYARKGELAAGQIRLMSLPGQGVSMPVTAIMLDAETSEGGTATDVDRKLLVKYGIKPLAAGFAAVAEYLKSAGTTVVVAGETVATTQPELTNKRAAQIVAGSAAQQIHSDANALDTTPTVRVSRGTIVGVFFTQDVIYSPRQ